MKNDDKQRNELRQLAEKRLSDRHKDPLKLAPDQLPALVHELEVHQIELEMQNEELRRAQESLEEARNLYMDLYDYAPVGYLTIGPTGLIEEANLTACSMFETERTTLKGQRLSHFVVAEYQDTLYIHRRRLLAGKGPQTFELKMWSAGDGNFFTHAKIVLLAGTIGNIGAYRIVITDISTRKQAEDERDRLQRELQQAHKWEALGKLAGGIAHDFNNLLGIILGSTELLRSHLNGLEPAKTSWYLEHIQKAGDRAAALVAKMLTFSHGKDGVKKPLQLRSIIREDIEMLTSLLPSSMQIKAELAEQLPDILLDPTEFSQALVNLCVNAQDAMDGTGILTVRLGWARNIGAECSICHRQIHGDWIELTVADTGCGIETELFDNIFEPFFSTKDIGKGTGLGLSVVLGVMQRSGGHLLFESELGKGTTFRLLFPPTSGLSEKTHEAYEHPATPANGEGEQILVLDDQPGLANVLGEVLNTHGYRTTVMTDSNEALNLFRKNPEAFALVLTDQAMPGLTGVELVKQLRGIRADIPVILSTGFSPYVDKKTAAEMNIGFLEKPVRAGNLLQAVAGMLQPSKKSAFNADRNPPPPPPTTDAPDR